MGRIITSVLIMIFESKLFFQSKQNWPPTNLRLSLNYLLCQTIQILSQKEIQTTHQIQHTSFFTAEEIVTIKMFKTIYRPTICVVPHFPYCQTIQILSLATEGCQTTSLQIQDTSFFTAEEIVTIKCLKQFTNAKHKMTTTFGPYSKD